MLVFNVAGIFLTYAIQRLQGVLPLNPQGFAAPTPDLAWNTAVSFATNTNWQSYGGEIDDELLHADARPRRAELRLRGVGHGGPGRAHARAHAQDDVDHRQLLGRSVRSTLYILLPLSIVVALLLVSQGVVQTFHAYETVPLLQATKDADGKAVTDQVLALGPGRVADRDQDARDERRRLLQRQLGAPVREPDRLLELPRDVGSLLVLPALSVTRSARW
jgi:potassium-transporting ATPase potassium-binding subunit